MRAMLCVGVAYFLIGVLAPVFTLASQGALNGFNKDGMTWAFVSGTLGAVGALGALFFGFCTWGGVRIWRRRQRFLAQGGHTAKVFD